MRGLGRGRGFKSTNKQSVDFSSPVVRQINDRLLQLVLMMISKRVTSQKDIVEKLQLDQYISNDAYKSLSDDLDDANEQLNQANRKIETYHLRFGRMSRHIAESLNEDFENWDVDEDDEKDDEDLDDEESKSIAFLEFGVDRIIDEVLAQKEDQEGNSSSE